MKRLTLVSTSVILLICVSQLKAQDHSSEKGKQNPDGSYSVIDQTATLPNGIKSLYAYISENIKYPKQARKSGVEGRVFIEFVIDKNGQMSKYKVLKGIGSGCDEEALRVLALFPDRWSPGKHEGKVVNQKIVLPISFKLGKNTDKNGDKS